jgi:hypothetical protein
MNNQITNYFNRIRKNNNNKNDTGKQIHCNAQMCNTIYNFS